MNKCIKCDIDLILNSNWIHHRFKKRDYICNACIKKRAKIYYEENQSKIKDRSNKYYEENKETKKQYALNYHKKNRTQILKKWKKIRLDSKPERECPICLTKIAKKKKGDRIYCSARCLSKSNRLNNYHKWRETIRKNKKRRYHTNPMNALKERIRTRLYSFLKYQNRTKSQTTLEMIGCDWETLKEHIESQFINGMTWENKDQWHIDHIIPLASANTEKEILKLAHYTNLQPLWAIENLQKGNKVYK